jgi:hypothetical protein
MTRKQDVFGKLDYADRRSNELADMMFSAGFENRTVAHLGLIASEILACSREIFDFCAIDIVEAIVVPASTEHAKSHAAGKLRAYYPFYKSQLTSKGSAFCALKSINLALHNHLFSIAAAIESKKARTDTLFNYGILTELSDMVNQKKHDRLLGINEGGETIYSKRNGFEMMTPLDEQANVTFRDLDPNEDISGKGYVFEFNKMEVKRFCMECRGLSRIVVTEIYDRFLP